MRGMYEMYLEVWLRHFPRDSFLIIRFVGSPGCASGGPAASHPLVIAARTRCRSEEYFKSPAATLQQAFQFLGLTSPSMESLAKMVKAGGKGTSYAKDKTMLPEARKLVTELYQPWNERLADLLGDEYYRNWTV